MAKSGYKVRLYPSPGQKIALARTFGNVRFIFNQYVNFRQFEYEHGYNDKETRFTFSELRSLLTSQNKDEFPWLSDSSSSALQEACQQADDAYWMMVKNRAKKRRAGIPRRRKYADQSFRLPGASSFKVLMTDRRRHRGQLYVPKIGWIKFRSGKNIDTASSVTVRMSRDGSQYHASFVIDAEEPQEAPERTVGIDLGLTDLMTLTASDGTREKVSAPRFYRQAERRLARSNRNLSRKKKGSRNRTKAKQELSRLHRKVRGKREDFLHKITTRVADNNHAVALESLNVAGMSRSRLAKSIYDASWSRITSMLDYKVQARGGVIARADRYAPTSRVCSLCGEYGGEKPLSIRVWRCESCGFLLDRDYNAAVNIIDAAGLAESLNACGEDIRPALALADLDEAGTHRKGRTVDAEVENSTPIPSGPSRKHRPSGR